jgi:hypothetical protein
VLRAVRQPCLLRSVLGGCCSSSDVHMSGTQGPRCSNQCVRQGKGCKARVEPCSAMLGGTACTFPSSPRMTLVSSILSSETLSQIPIHLPKAYLHASCSRAPHKSCPLAIDPIQCPAAVPMWPGLTALAVHCCAPQVVQDRTKDAAIQQAKRCVADLLALPECSSIQQQQEQRGVH